MLSDKWNRQENTNNKTTKSFFEVQNVLYYGLFLISNVKKNNSQKGKKASDAWNDELH